MGGPLEARAARFVWLPTRLAWRMLRADPARLVAAALGVMFACVLMFMQLGFRDALFSSAMALVSPMRADAFLVHRMTAAAFKAEAIPRARASQALALSAVESAVPVYLAQTTWRNPGDGTRHTIQLIGFDPGVGVMDLPGHAELAEALRREDTAAYDRLSRPEFGDVPALLRQAGPFEAQLGTRTVTVIGLVAIGSSFGAGGNVVLSESNFLRIVGGRSPNAVDLVALRFQPGTPHGEAIAMLRTTLPPDVRVMTQDEFGAHERAYWEKNTPIGFVFAFGSIMALVVGVVIVYQVLFSVVTGHLREFATLKAMGYGNGYLGRCVLGASVIMAVLGFTPGFALSVLLYELAQAQTLLPVTMNPARVAAVFALVFAMCATAGLFAMRKLREAVPTEMF